MQGAALDGLMDVGEQFVHRVALSGAAGIGSSIIRPALGTGYRGAGPALNETARYRYSPATKRLS